VPDQPTAAAHDAVAITPEHGHERQFHRTMIFSETLKK
jgi:hypothetical protein